MTDALAVGLLLAWLPYTGFVLLYGLRSPWYTSPLGRSLLLSKAMIFGLISHFLAVRWIGQYPGRDVVTWALIGAAVVAGWTQLWMLLRTQGEARRDRETTR